MKNLKKGFTRTPKLGVTPKGGGFTLIELLVVVAIIGILASVVLASLSSARSKGSDARIKSQLNNMIAQAELYSGGSAEAFSPAATCAKTSGTIFETVNNGLGNFFNNLTLADMLCYSAAGDPSLGANWAVAAKLSGTAVWCVDSNGTRRDKNASGTPYNSLASALSGTSCN